MNETTWPQPGDAVVEYAPGSRTYTAVTDTTVERLTKTLIVLANGNRYRREDKPRRSTGTWSPTYHLLRPDDPQVVAARRKQDYEEVRSISWRIEKAMVTWRRDGNDAAARDALARLRTAIAAIDALDAQEAAS